MAAQSREHSIHAMIAVSTVSRANVRNAVGTRDNFQQGECMVLGVCTKRKLPEVCIVDGLKPNPCMN